MAKLSPFQKQSYSNLRTSFSTALFKLNFENFFSGRKLKEVAILTFYFAAAASFGQILAARPKKKLCST